jgi:demethylmenaquinone methyltransferase/2-methoxy-6-polyprenyl-1,4-benzoquinol methylase
MKLDFSPVAPVYDRLNDLISLGLHRLWKRRLVRELKARAAKGCWLDIASGTGDVAALMVKAGVRDVVAVEPCHPMVIRGKARTHGRVRWVEAPSECIPLPDRMVAAIACSFGVRNFTDRRLAFTEWNRVLVDGGLCGILEMHPPRSRLFLGLFQFYWRWIMPSLGRLVGRASEYRYLKESVEQFVTPAGLAEEARAAGLEPVGSSSLFGEGMVSLSLFRKHGGHKENSDVGRGDRVLRDHR